MPHSQYLIIGSSHAALEAVQAIRMHDPDGSLTLITRDPHLPYSPTVLPYVVSGRSRADAVALRDQAYFDQHNVAFIPARQLISVAPEQQQITLDNGEHWRYDKLLLATGAKPVIPPIPGLDQVDYRVLRTLDDASALHQACTKAKRAIVLGAGLVGMHGAENLAKAGLEVTVIEMQSQVLPGYFDPQAAAMIEAEFNRNGIHMCMSTKAERIEPLNEGCRVTLSNGETLEADVLLVSTGVQPVIDYCDGTGIECAEGIVVNDQMATSQPAIWAAGDVTQARDFYADAKVVTGIVPNAVEQGRIAGMAMAEDPALGTFPGGIPINTYNFYGQQAVSVGLSQSNSPSDEIALRIDSDNRQFQKIIIKDNQLQGISVINAQLDPGIMWQLILRRIDLSDNKGAFIARPQETARRLMSANWR